MSITGVGSKSSLVVQSLVDMRRQLDDLQRQLGTGKMSDNYAGLGLDRGLAVGLRSHLAALGGYRRRDHQCRACGSISPQIDARRASPRSRASVKSSALQSLRDDREQRPDRGAAHRLFELGEILGPAQHAGRRPLPVLRPRRATSRRSRRSSTSWMATARAPASSRSIAERNQADLGASGLGRLVISAPTATSVRLAEDAVSPFGFKLAGVTSNLTRRDRDAGPAGAPASMRSISAPSTRMPARPSNTASPCPTASSESITLTATTSAHAGTGRVHHRRRPATSPPPICRPR